MKSRKKGAMSSQSIALSALTRVVEVLEVAAGSTKSTIHCGANTAAS